MCKTKIYMKKVYMKMFTGYLVIKENQPFLDQNKNIVEYKVVSEEDILIIIKLNYNNIIK